MFSFRKSSKTSDSTTPESSMHPRVAVLISAGKVFATIWQVNDHTVEVLGIGEKTYSTQGKEQALVYKELLNASADAIDMACNVAEVDVQQAIFGIPQTWLSDEQLLPEYEEVIEKLNKDLSLEGVAYVSVPHAISYYLQYLHKIPPTILLVGMTREGATISYVEAGKVLETHRISWTSSSAAQAIYRGILLFKNETTEVTSVYLYGFGNLEIARKELNSFDWQKTQDDASKPAFIQKPQVHVLSDQVESYAVSFVGAKDFAKQQGLKGRLQMHLPLTATESISDPLIPSNIPELSATQHQAMTTLPASAAVPTGHKFGFVQNADIAAKSDSEPVDIPEASKDDAPDEELSDTTATVETESFEEDNFAKVRIQDWHDQQSLEQDHAGIEAVEPVPHKKRLQFSFNFMPKKRLLVSVVVLLFLVFGLGAAAVYAYWTIPTAEVTVYVKPQSIPKEITITASEKSTISVTERTIPAAKVTVDVADKKSVAATGTKTVGEKAEGTVTLYNKTTNAQALKKGTVLKTNNLEFELTADVSVASASASIEGQTNGKSEGQVQARQIGTASNLKDQATLSVGTFPRSEVEAVAKGDFSGGTEKEVKIVSSRDLAKLREELLTSVEAKVAATVQNQTSTSDIVLDKAWTKSEPKLKYSQKANDEAASVEGDVTVTVTAYTVKQSDVQQLLSSVADQNVPEGYELQSKDDSSRTEFVSFADGLVTLKAFSNIEVIPQLDTNSLADKIVGKKELAARDIILADTRIFDVSFRYSVTLPESLSSLPRSKENITIKRAVRDLNI